jgi:hypothetical protein
MKSENSSHFKFEKLYLDCIDEHGNCFIIYKAKIQFLFIRIHYSELIYSDPLGATTMTVSLKKIREVLAKDLLLYFNYFLQIKGSWSRIDSPLPSFSFKDPTDRQLTWNCHHPKALTEIIYEDSEFTGFGYAETLTLTIKPWNLPIDELRWGRFLSADYTITWIKWKGTYPLNKIFCNGTEYNDAVFEERRIIFGEGIFSLEFMEIKVIRKGRLSEIFSKIWWLKLLYNKSLFNTIEAKYKAKSALTKNLEFKSNGWSLFELVTWGK